MIHCFLALGANLHEPLQTVKRALEKIRNLRGIYAFSASRNYLSAPVSPLPQNPFVNAVCSFWTLSRAEELFCKLNTIEIELGKRPKPKEAPREIDIDFLFYGTHRQKKGPLILPHPLLYHRLFVLQPLSDLTDELPVPDPETGEKSLNALLKTIKAQNTHELVLPLGE